MLTLRSLVVLVMGAVSVLVSHVGQADAGVILSAELDMAGGSSAASERQGPRPVAIEHLGGLLLCSRGPASSGAGSQAQTSRVPAGFTGDFPKVIRPCLISRLSDSSRVSCPSALQDCVFRPPRAHAV